MTGSACSYDAVYEEDLPGFLAVKTHFWDKGHPDVELYLRRRTIDGDWIWLKAKAVSYVDQPIPGIILMEQYVEDENVAYQVNRVTRIAAILVQAVEASHIAHLANLQQQQQAAQGGDQDQFQQPNNVSMSDNGSPSSMQAMMDSLGDSNGQIPWVADDAAAYQAMFQNAAKATGMDASMMEDPLERIMKAAVEAGAGTMGKGDKNSAASQFEQEIMERVGGKKKEIFDPFSVMEEVREGVRLDLGTTRLSRTEAKMITLVLTGRLAVDDLCVLVFEALSSGYGLDAALSRYPLDSEGRSSAKGRVNGMGMQRIMSPQSQQVQSPPPPISVVNLSYTYMGNTAIEMLGEVLYMENSLLRTIDISFCGIEEKGCVALAKALNRRQRNGVMPLRGIILSGNHISYRAATDLGRALSPDQHSTDSSGRRSARTASHSRGKRGGYDEESESEEDDDFDPDESGFFGRSSRKRSSAPKPIENANSEKYFSKDHGLQVVHLGSAMMDAESTAQFLHGLGPRSPVREICLASNSIGPAGAALLVSFLEGKGMPRGKSVMPHLDRLDLSNNNLGNDGLTKLTRAISKRSGNHFVDLRLSNNGIGHGGIETIMNKLLQHNLVSLSLDKNAIGDQGCQLVAASLQSMPCLARLNLAFNQIGSRGVNSLMRALVACESVTYLALSGNIMKISGAVALAFTLAQHPRLEELNVDNCCLSQAAQCHIIAGIISNRWVPMKRMNGFEAQPPMVAIGALKMVTQTLTNEECFRIRKDEQMKTILQWMETNRVAKKKQSGAQVGGAASSEAYQHFLTPDFVQSQNDVQGIPSQNPYLRLLGWLSRIPFDEDELIALRRYFYDNDGGSEDRGSDGYINLKLRGDLLAALESDVADEIRDETPMLVQYVGSVGMDIDALSHQSSATAWDYMQGMSFEKTQRLLVAEDAIIEEYEAAAENAYDRGEGDDMDDDSAVRRKRMVPPDMPMHEYSRAMSSNSMGRSRNSMSTMSRASMRSMNHSESERSNASQGERERRRGGGLKARITMFPQFEAKLEDLKATATDMIEQEEDPEQQEVILTQYAEASLTILRQLRYHCMNSGLDGWRQGSMKRKVLIVDDSGVTRKLVSRAFEKAGFIVDTASNGKEGVEKLKRAVYDIAFMDIDMPVMNGFEATKKLREWEDMVRPGTRQPICALTAAYVDDFERSELMKRKEAGLDVMESKPCNIPRLFKVVDDVSPMFSDLSISVIQQGGGSV